MLLKKLRLERRRVLIMSQMVLMLDILEMFLNFHFVTYIRIDENANSEQRQVRRTSASLAGSGRALSAVHIRCCRPLPNRGRRDISGSWNSRVFSAPSPDTSLSLRARTGIPVPQSQVCDARSLQDWAVSLRRQPWWEQETAQWLYLKEVPGQPPAMVTFQSSAAGRELCSFPASHGGCDPPRGRSLPATPPDSWCAQLFPGEVLPTPPFPGCRVPSCPQALGAG